MTSLAFFVLILWLLVVPQDKITVVISIMYSTPQSDFLRKLSYLHRDVMFWFSFEIGPMLSRNMVAVSRDFTRNVVSFKITSSPGF